ncbi:MAG: penicillin acylase family protein [Ginsengibacter sp.]
MHHTRLAILVSLTFFLTSNLFSQQKYTLKIQNLIKPVEVLRDQWGVNHIYAQNEHDLFFTQGYCAAKDRLFQFEIWRRQATGTVAEILGEKELTRDIGTRLFKFRGNLNSELQHYHHNGIQIINAYVDGVNQYITTILKTPDQLPIEFKLLHLLPGLWTPEVVISRHQGLLGNVTEELKIGRAVAASGPEKVKSIMWFHPKDPIIDLDPSITADLLSKDILALYKASHTSVFFNKEELEPEGSNNWIVSGSRTASGHTMLANDPHRKIAVPSLRYIVHLVAPGWNVIGGGEPEIPGVSVGHNEEGAWGLTIYETDGEDLYVYDLNPNDLTSYKYNGQWIKMKELDETIPVKNQDPRSVKLRYTIHGPVTFIDSVNHKAYAVKCAWLEPGGAPYLASLRIDQAKTWESFRDACSYSHIPGENMIWADKKGNIGWQAIGIAPIRKNFSGLVPVPGDGRFEWSGYLPLKERPHLLNPKQGYFATANQNVTPTSYHHWDAVGYSWADSFRGDRINNVLNANKHITISQMEALQTDYFSIPATSFVPFLKNISFNDPLTTEAKKIITNWNFIMGKNSIAAGIYAMWEQQIMLLANKKWIPNELKPFLSFQTSKVIQRLYHPEQISSTESTQTRDNFIKESFENAVNALKNKLGASTAQWVYGQDKYKHITMIHQLSDLVDNKTKNKLDIGPLPRGGNAYTPGSTGSSDNQQSGASFRLIVDTGDWDKAVMINTPGQSGDPASPYYSNLFSLWGNDKYFPAYYSKKKILKTVKEHWQLNPLSFYP